MSDQLQGMAGRDRKVNKRLRVPMTEGLISELFSVLWAHYPATVFDEGETEESLRKRMRMWAYELFSKRHVSPEVFKAVVRELEGLEKYERDVKCPTLARVVDLCELKQAELNKPRDMGKVNAERAKLKAMVKGEKAA